ncbi:uncharacterized protein LOC112271686 [Brachypodium distachyon]|uniref:uncharacterized protein LOC112271686 n=1 Tax=Brachypodium distachyon TaxID=15368 RepID=UPI000D0CE725|nr:uncharacterized protein LOC112271686 [Brachypodium distachyon]|eukprot:XP_024317208.1 uncharacterized protein LOC112271686 [Brachypodium distachyon]
MPLINDDGGGGGDDDDDMMELIPDLAIYTILTRLPPSSATRSKLVCKSWSSMVSSRSGQGSAELLNPATGGCLQLGGDRAQDRDTRTAAEQLPWYCLGRCGGEQQCYKVVRLDVRLPYNGRPHVTCEVCALDRDALRRRQWRWQEVAVLDVACCPTGRGVHIGGVVYYLVDLVYSSVVSFDLSTHVFGHMDHPGTADGMVASLSELDGRLCASMVPAGVLDSCGDGGARNMDVWVLTGDDENGGKRWTHKYTFELDGTARHVPRPLFVTGDGMLVMKCADGSLCHYDVWAKSGSGSSMDDGEVLVFQHKSSGRRMTGTTADVFVESLLPLRTILKGN